MALNMSQSTYSRVEKSDVCCARHLANIAKALGTTPDELRTYRPACPPQQTVEEELTAARTLITQQQQQIEQHLTTIRHWEQVWHQHCGGGAKTLSRNATAAH